MSHSRSSSVGSAGGCSPLPSIPVERRHFKQRPRPTRDTDPHLVQMPDSFWRFRETEPGGDVMQGGRDHKWSFNRCKLKIHILLKVIHNSARVLKILNRQSEIHTATDFVFESDVFLHSDVERDCSACRMASFCTENGPALLVRHPSVACEKARRFGLSEVD